MTKKRLFFGLIILAVLGYCALFVFDRWKADVWGTISGLQPAGEFVLLQVDSDRKTRDNPTGRVIVLLTPKTSISEENYFRVRQSATVEALQPGKKVLVQYFSPLAYPATPLGRPVSDVLLVKW